MDIADNGKDKKILHKATESEPHFAAAGEDFENFLPPDVANYDVAG